MQPAHAQVWQVVVTRALDDTGGILESLVVVAALFCIERVDLELLNRGQLTVGGLRLSKSASSECQNRQRQQNQARTRLCCFHGHSPVLASFALASIADNRWSNRSIASRSARVSAIRS